MTAPTSWCIWSNEHKAWWRPEGRGYTTDQSQAGIFGHAEAKHIIAHSERGKEKMVRVPKEKKEGGVG